MYEEISTNKPQSRQTYDSNGGVYGDSFRNLQSQKLFEINHQPEEIEQPAVKESLKGATHELEFNFNTDYTDGTSSDYYRDGTSSDYYLDGTSSDFANIQRGKRIEQSTIKESLKGAKHKIEFDNDYSDGTQVELANVKGEVDESSQESNDDTEDVKEDVDTSQVEELSQSDEEVYPQLSIDNVIDKLNDMAEDCAVLEDIQHIGSDNLEKLQTLSRSNPMMKRLFANNRLTSRDVKTTIIDSDIKSSVSEFLKNNVVGNFIISRVLRENYATFFGWLATHLQSERNLWLLRLKQTFDHYEILRRDNIGNNDVIIDSGQKVEVLLHLCRQSVPLSSNLNIPTLSPLQPLPSLSGDSHLVSENKEIGSKLRSPLKLSNKPKIASSLAPANSVINNKENISEDCKTNVEVKDGQRHCLKSSKSELVHSNSTPQLKNTKTYNINTEETSSHLDGATDLINTRKQYIEGIGDCKDWKEVLRNGFQELQELCEDLLLDRNNCLKHLGADSSISLTEAVIAFVNKRKNSGQSKRREIEQRLGLLEVENKELIQEMASLQNLLTDKQKDALNLQKQLDKLEKLLNSATYEKLHKCVGTDDIERTVVSNGSNKQRNTHSDNVGQTPYRYKMMTNGNSTHKVSKENNISNIRRIEHERRELKGNHDKFDLTHNTGEKYNHTNSVESQTTNGQLMVKEKSLIEISEEKLKILKQRAQKLEHSLHDAISNMTLLDKKKDDVDDLSLQLNPQPATRPCQGNQPMKSLANRLHMKGSSPRLAVIRRPLSQGRSQSETLLVSEPTSFLTGRSVALTSHNPADRSFAQSVLTVMADKHKSDIQTKRDYEQYINNRDPGGFGNYINREQSTGKAVKVKVISRHRATSNGMVSKCLRCQKLFCAVDNHKMACFYHTKEKERIEHYDQAGKLLRVAQMWICCHQPQEIEGCCYGQHI